MAGWDRRSTVPNFDEGTDQPAIIDIVTDGIAGTAMPASWSLSEPEVASVAAYVGALGRRPAEPLTGDPVAGRAVYTRAGCGTCHIIDGQGTAVGPELSSIGALRGLAFLRQSLVDPAASRPERPVPYEPYAFPAYVTVRLKPRGGAEVTGIRLNEDSFTIQVRDETGRIRSFRKTELETVRVDHATSIMPSYRDLLTSREIDDLVAYLMTLGIPR